jgi:hypothetical protein
MTVTELEAESTGGVFPQLKVIERDDPGASLAFFRSFTRNGGRVQWLVFL